MSDIIRANGPHAFGYTEIPRHTGDMLMDFGVLRLRKGAGQIRLDEEALYERITQALRADSREMEFTQLTGTITELDVVPGKNGAVTVWVTCDGLRQEFVFTPF